MNTESIKAFIVSTTFVLAACTAIPIACYVSQPTQAQPAKSATANPNTAWDEELEQRLIAKERQSWELAIKGDAAAYKALHAPEFFSLSGEGITDREHTEAGALDANVHFDSCNFSDFHVRFIAKSIALMTYHVKATGFDHGKPFLFNSYLSSIWQEKKSTWLNTFYQSTPATAK
jgi:hypothetical protein